MAAFDISVDGKTYKMFYDRASVRQFEEIGGNISDMKEKMFSTTDRLFYVGLQKFHPQISFSEAQELSDKSIQEFGINNVYAPLMESFMAVFTEAGSNATTGKSFLVSKSAKA